MIPLQEARHVLAKFVGESGKCPEEPEVVEAINEARRVLYPMGDWMGITDPICVKPYACAITLPADYEYAKKGYVCNGRITIQNDWFTPVYGEFDSLCGSCINPLKRLPGNHATFREWPIVRRKEHTCCPEDGFYIKLLYESDNDCGTPLTFNGIGVSRRRVHFTRVHDAYAWKPTLAQPGELPLLKLESVIKPRTDGRIRVYGYDGANEFLMAIYEPEDINPSYARYAIGRFTSGILLKAKKRYKPLVNETDFLDLNPEALIHALQAITDRQARNTPGFNANLTMARDFLNRELQGYESTATSPMRMSNAYRVTGLVEYG